MSLQSRLRASIAPKAPTLKVVVQAGKTSGDWVPLTVYDLLTGHIYTEQALFFSQMLDGKALRASLAQTLCDFPVLSGRITTDGAGREGIFCSDAGVLFVEKQVDKPMPAYGPTCPAKDDLRRYVQTANPLRVVNRDTPLVIIQLTHLAGGGSVLGVAVNHSLADAFSAAAFLASWSRLHRGQPALGQAAELSHDRRQFQALAQRADPNRARRSELFQVVSRMDQLRFYARLLAGSLRLQTRVLRLSEQEVQALKSAANAELSKPGQWVSTNDALTAHIWQQLSALRDRPDASMESLGLLFDVRRQLGLPASYFGNAVSNTLPTRSAQELRTLPLGQLAHHIRAEREKRTRDELYAELAFLEERRNAGQSRRILPRLMLEIFQRSILINNYSKLPFYEVDFGGGTPFWYDMAMGPVPWQVIVASTPSQDGGKDLHICAPAASIALLQRNALNAHVAPTARL